MKKTSLVLSLLLILGPLARTETHINSCPTEGQLIRQFNAVSANLTGSNGVSCQIEEHKEDHHDDEHHNDEEHHNEEHETGSNHSCSGLTCMNVFNLCRSVIISLNLTTEECLEHGHTEGTNISSTVVHPSQAYGYGFLMILFVCLCSLLGVFLVPLINSKSKVGRQTYEYVYALMVAVGISALISDAVLHLIPHSFGLHSDEGSDGHDGHGHDEEGGGHSNETIWKGCLVLLGMYLFYILEVILHGVGDRMRKKYSSSVSHHGHSHYGYSTGDGHYSASNVPEVKTEAITKLDNEHDDDKGISSKSETIELVSENSDNKLVEPNGGLAENEDLTHTTGSKISKIKPVAWLIIIGDALHNFADGLALGAAIAQNLTLGLSTMFALIFHEVPHELGDYVILIKSGMHWAFALVFNFLSSLTAVIGFFIGVAISTYSAAANGWILAITAGLFFYIALTDLLPELIHGGEHVELTKTGWRWGLRFLLANLGFFISFALILILAVYEESLNELIK